MPLDLWAGQAWNHAKSFNFTLERIFSNCNVKHDPYQDCSRILTLEVLIYAILIMQTATPFVMGQLSVESRKRVRLKGCLVKEIRQGLEDKNIDEGHHVSVLQ